MSNLAAARFFSMLISPSLAKQSNVLRSTFHPEGSRRWIVNWLEVERDLLNRAELELGSQDSAGGTLLAEIRSYASAPTEANLHVVPRPGDLLLPIHIRVGGLDLRLFTTIMTLGTPHDVHVAGITDRDVLSRRSTIGALLDAEFWRVAQTNYELGQSLCFLAEPRLSRAAGSPSGKSLHCNPSLAFLGEPRVRRLLRALRVWEDVRPIPQDAIVKSTWNLKQESECFGSRLSVE